MKNKKVKLLALTMSVLMATSSMPSATFAADLFSDGSAVEFAAEEAAPVEETAPAEEAAPAEASAVFAEEADTDDATLQAASSEYKVVEGSVEFHYGELSEKDDFKVNYTAERVGKDGKAEYEVIESTATIAKTIPATCTQPEKIILQVLAVDGEYYPSDTFVTGKWNGGLFVQNKALGHQYKEVKREVVKSPTHYDTGRAHVWYVCDREEGTVCDAKHAYETDLELPAQEHDWEDQVTYEPRIPEGQTSSNIKLDKDGKVVLGEDGLPILVDATRDGYYYTVVYCKKDDGGEKDRKEKTLFAKKGVYAVIEDQKGIATPLKDKRYEINEPTTSFPIPEESIELEKCTEPGYYVVAYYSADGNRISDETIKVAPHHYLKGSVIEFASEKDKELCNTPYKDKNGNWVVTSKSCYLSVDYYEVEHCYAKGCPNDYCNTKVNQKTYTCENTTLKEYSRTKKVAEPVGEHTINTDVKKVIDKYAKAGKTDAGEKFTYEELKELVKAKGVEGTEDTKAGKATYIKVSNDTSTCEKDGTATVEYYCMVCKKLIKTETVKVVAKGHKRLAPTRENYEAPTCEKEGHYDAVVYCKNCNEVLEKRENVRIPRLAHTNEVGVVQNEKGEDVGTKNYYSDKNAKAELLGDVVVDDYSSILNAKTDAERTAAYAKLLGKNAAEYIVSAQAYTLCDVCGKNKVAPLKTGTPVITVDKVVKQGKDCQPGSITLTATYTRTSDGKKVTDTKTVPYYSSVDAYHGRTAHDPAAPVKENVVEATATENGSYDEVVYCSVCGTEISRRTVTVTATGDIILPAVTGLKATAAGMKRVALSWDAVEGAEGYFVIGFGENRTGSQIAYTTRTSWTDTAADSDAFNFYWVQPFCRNAAGKIVKGELGGYKYALGRVVSTTGKVTAVATEDGVELSWDAVSGANSYVVMSKTGSSTAAFNASVATDTNSFVDTAAASGEVTYYWVYATYKNADGKVLAAGKTSPFAWAIAK